MSRKRLSKAHYLVAAIDFGYTLLGAVVVFGGAGWWLDNRLETRPWFLLAGIGLGLTVGFHSLIRRLNYLERLSRRSPDSGEGADPHRPGPPRGDSAP
ncbi:MAG TPA: AtpZ/AtpI family protein [Symbiobacteriaceae bacterium]